MHFKSAYSVVPLLVPTVAALALTACSGDDSSSAAVDSGSTPDAPGADGNVSPDASSGDAANDSSDAATPDASAPDADASSSDASTADASTDAPTDSVAIDTTPPTFAGLVSATPVSDTKIHLAWAQATDLVTPNGQIVYDVYQAASMGGESYAQPTFTTAGGALGADITGLSPQTAYYFVVRARDASGNADTNVIEKKATTPADGTAPLFGGATSVMAVDDTHLTVAWTHATDDVDPQGSIVYEVCFTTTAVNCTNAFSAIVTTAAGASSATVGGIGVLSPSTTYYFVVRAKDTSGNVDTNVNVVSGSTAVDATPPTQSGGITVANVMADGLATSGELNVSWSAASDDASPASAISYQLCWATGTTCQTTFVAMATTAPGATNYLITGLPSYTTHNVSMRARDGAGNVEVAPHSGSAQTAVSYTTNIFGQIYNGSAGSGGGCDTNGCHGVPPGGWSYANTVNVASCGGYYVHPGDPSNSLIYKKMAGTFGACGANRMPLGGPYNPVLIQMMLDWINQGAHNN